jgi:hypothetical protein
MRITSKTPSPRKRPSSAAGMRASDVSVIRPSTLVSVGEGIPARLSTLWVVLGNPSCQAELEVAQVILTSIEYTK